MMIRMVGGEYFFWYRLTRVVPDKGSKMLLLLLLWPPYVIGQAIIFLPCGFFLLLSSFFLLLFHRLISAAADWMSTVLQHLVWPWCEFRMQVWNVLHAARWKYRTQKNWHFGNIAQLCRAISSELRHVSTIGKNFLNSNTSSTCPDNMVNFGLPTVEIRWRVWGTPTNFNEFRVLAALLDTLLD